jgi:hypothetical protein
MSLYNVEVFDRQTFNCIFHDAIERPEYHVDYLNPVDNTAAVRKTEVLQEGQLIRINGDEYDFFGVITSVGNDQEGLTTIYYRHFLYALSQPILFNCEYQKTTSLEATIAHYVNNVFVSNNDTLQTIVGLQVRFQTNTTFTFSLKPDTEGGKYCVVDLYDAIIAPALSKYGVAISVTADPQAKTIDLAIRKVADAVTIEADLPNVFDCRVTVAETSNDVNKLLIYNDSDFSEKKIYYLHPDRTYDTTNADRILPVSRKIDIVSVASGQTFAQAAADAAEETFGDIDISNLIEVDVANTDKLIKPMTREIGERTTIIKGGKAYKSILTGMTVGSYTTLIYGAMRLDITDLIRKGG